MALLEIVKLRKTFNGLVAVDEVTFGVQKGTITSLIGPNGAGKTTLFNMISGLEKPTSGSIIFEGQELTRLKGHEICRLGIGRVFQIPKIFSELSVLENVMVGLHPRSHSSIIKTGFHLPGAAAGEREMRQRAHEKLETLHLGEHQDKPSGTLPFGNQRLLEIARALATEPTLLLLDEVAGGLTPVETDVLKGIIRKIRSQGITIMIVEHNLGMVMDISDHIVVLNYGKKICEGPPPAIRSNPEVIEAYIGKRKMGSNDASST